MGNDIFPRGNHIVGIVGAQFLALLCAVLMVVPLYLNVGYLV